MNADGTDVSDRLITECSHDPDCSPDGRKIAFVMGDNSQGYNIYVMNADGSNVVPLTEGRHVWDHPDWSPDGRRIVFSAGQERSGGNIMVVNADGSGLTALYDAQTAENPRCSPDGKHIVFAVWQIYVMNADGTGVTQITNSEWSNGWPTWSPDGKYIAFVRNPDGEVNRYLYVMDADGTDVRQLSTEPACCPTWSPDGEYIAFENPRWDTLWVIRADGSGLTALGKGRVPCWTR